MLERIIPFSHKKLLEVVDKNSIVVDATCGNGNDTLFLCSNVKYVYGFDIQKEALQNTKTLLDFNNKSNYELILDGHENIKKYIHQPIDAVIFNLGYLPSFDKTITTMSDTTLTAISDSLDLIKVNGLVIITIYTGHENGLNESVDVYNYAKTLNSKFFNVLKYEFINKVKSPYIIIIEKTKDV